MNITKDNSIGEIVAQDYRTASVFKSYQIDFCCNGNRSLNEVCETENIDAGLLIEELHKASQQNTQSTKDFHSWDIDLLSDYIEKKHHRYVENKIPELQSYLNTIVNVHGDQHPELIEIEKLFNASALELLVHMKKEETILFPYVRKLMEENSPQFTVFDTIQNPIQTMMQEHDNEGNRFREIAKLSNNYNPPKDACNTYKLAYKLLKEFEEDLHLHIHLENNILFPKAIELEEQISTSKSN